MSLSYADELRSIIDTFDYELCQECGMGLEHHVISPDPIGHPHLWCVVEVAE